MIQFSKKTIADKLADAAKSGKEAKFIVGGITYEFSPTGLASYLLANQPAFSTTFVSVPANASASGTAGQLAYDTSYLYIFVRPRIRGNILLITLGKDLLNG